MPVTNRALIFFIMSKYRQNRNATREKYIFGEMGNFIKNDCNNMYLNKIFDFLEWGIRGEWRGMAGNGGEWRGMAGKKRGKSGEKAGKKRGKHLSHCHFPHSFPAHSPQLKNISY